MSGVEARAGSTRSSPYPYAAALGVLGAAILLVVGTWYAAGATTKRVADNAEQLQWANSAVGALSIARASNAQAFVFAVDERQGVTTELAVQKAINEGQKNLDALDALASAGPPTAQTLLAEIRRYAEDGRQLLELLRSGDLDDAASLNDSVLDPSYQDLTVAAQHLRSEIQGRIDASQDASSRAGAILSFLGMFLLPAAVIVVYWWITRRQVRERRIRMEAELDAARELNQAKDRFIAALSHELRTPLTGIYGFSQVLGELCEHDPAKLELVDLISSESAELSRMVEDVLVAARADAGAIEFSISDVDPEVEIETVVQGFRGSHKSVEIDCAGHMVRADRLRLRQIIRNLVANAVKHGGDHIRIESRANEGMVEIAVSDDGPGIAPDMRDRLFDRFTHDGEEALLAGSVGLGLAIARSLARKMRGDVIYDDTAPSTTFCLALPSAAVQLPADPFELPAAEEVA